MDAPLPPLAAYPIVAYPNPDSAVRWLQAAFDVSIVHSEASGGGRVVLHAGDAVIVVVPLAPDDDGRRATSLVVAEDVLAVHERVEALDGSVGPVRVTASGGAEFTCTDPGGVSWTVTDDDPWRYV